MSDEKLKQRVRRVLDSIEDALGPHTNYFEVRADQILLDEPDRVSLLVEITPVHNKYLEWEDCVVTGDSHLLVFEQEDDDEPVIIAGEDDQLEISKATLYASLYWAEATDTADGHKAKRINNS